MFSHPLLKTNCRVERVEPDLVFLISSAGTRVLEGRDYYELVPYLTGEFTIAELTERLDGVLSFMKIHRALLRLERKGYIVAGQVALPSDLAPFVHTLNVSPADAAKRLSGKTIGVLEVGQVSGDRLRQRLRECSVNLVPHAEADFVVVVAHDYLDPELEALNGRLIASNTPWMLVRPQTSLLWVGPIFEHATTGCWACLEQRLSLHRRVDQFLQSAKKTAQPFGAPSLGLPMMADVAFNLAALEVLRWVISGKNERLATNLIEIDVETLQLEEHRFVKRPQCALCGDKSLVAERQKSPIVLQSRPKKFTTDGGHRIMTPDQTVAAYEHHVSHLTGVVNTLQEVAEEQNGLIHGFGCGVNIKGAPEDYDHLRGLLDGGDGGKGATRIQAKASGLCESIERYSGSFQGDEYHIKASYHDLGDEAIHPYKLLNYSEAQYSMADSYNATVSGYNYVPPQFDEHAMLDWTPVWSLTQSRFRYLPTSYLYFNFSRDPAVPACSNGNAAGNCIEEAILQGFFELVERDAVGIWWYNRLQRELVSLESFENDYMCNLSRYYRTIGYELWALNITTDLDIPVFAGIARRTNNPTENILLGFGAHFDPTIAMLRTLTEVNQGLCQFLTHDGLDKIPNFNVEANHWWETATIANQPYLLPSAEMPPITRDDFASQWTNDVKLDVMRCVDIAAGRGMETLVLDQTQPDVGLSVVKVLVPGLRHFWRRLGGGRLYDVPVQMGWRSEPNSEDALNPLNIHF